jgi:hypothetical protein
MKDGRLVVGWRVGKFSCSLIGATLLKEGLRASTFPDITDAEDRFESARGVDLDASESGPGAVAANRLDEGTLMVRLDEGMLMVRFPVEADTQDSFEVAL